MKEFEVTITETLQKSITVAAATREEAQAMVEEMWDKGDVVLDADHFVSAEFSCNDGQEIEADKDIYAGYRASGYSKAYYEEHEDEIKLCKASKRAFRCV